MNLFFSFSTSVDIRGIYLWCGRQGAVLSLVMKPTLKLFQMNTSSDIA